MATLIDFLPMMASQQIGFQSLERTPEPSPVMDGTANVAQYDRVMGTKLALAYAVVLEMLHRASADAPAGTAIDLAAGPGHFTLCLSRYLGYSKVVGTDLSPTMVDTARENAAKQGLDDRVEFRQGDVRELGQVPSGQFNLSSFTGAAHHMPDLASVRGVLLEMDRITKPEGLVMVMDLVRLRTAKLTDRYVGTVGRDYVERGLPDFFDDFRDSMYAAWTASELHGAIPSESERYWCQIVPRGLPTMQVFLGLPVGRKRAFVRSGFPWGTADHPVAQEMRGEWNLLRMTMRFASRRFVAPPSSLARPALARFIGALRLAMPGRAG